MSLSRVSGPAFPQNRQFHLIHLFVSQPWFVFHTIAGFIPSSPPPFFSAMSVGGVPDDGHGSALGEK